MKMRLVKRNGLGFFYDGNVMKIGFVKLRADLGLIGDVWIRDTPFGPVTDSMIVANKFGLTHHNVLRAISKVHDELDDNSKLKIDDNFIESYYGRTIWNRKENA
jgi:phage regulator Rha-like protein